MVRKKLAKCLAKAEKCRSIAANKNTMYVLKHSGQEDAEDEGGGPGGTGGGEFTPEGTGGGDFAPGSMENPTAASIKNPKKSSRWTWPTNLNAYRLSQVLSADIWLVTFIDSEHNDSPREALMLGIPRVNTPSSSQNASFRSSRSKHDTALSLGLTLRTAKNSKRNRKGPYGLLSERQLTTSQRFLSHEKMLAAIEQEIRTESTIFCLIKSSDDRVKFARKVREVITTAGHPHCQGIGTGTDQCQACKLRASQRNMTLNHSSSSSSNCSSEEDCTMDKSNMDNTIGVSRDLGIIKESRAGSTMIVENDEEEVREGVEIRRNSAVTVIDSDKVKRTQSNNSSSALETSEPDSGKPRSSGGSSGEKKTNEQDKSDATFPPKSIIQFNRKHRRPTQYRFSSDEISPPTSGVGSENSSPRSSRCPSSDTDNKNKNAATKARRKAAAAEMKEIDLRDPVKETPETENNNEALLSQMSNIKIN